MTRSLIAGLVLAVALGGGGVLLLPVKAHRGTDEHKVEREIDELRRAVAALGQERHAASDGDPIRRLEQRVSQLAQRQEETLPTAPFPQNSATPEPQQPQPQGDIRKLSEERQARNKQRIDEFGDKLDTLIDAEPTDVSWRNETLSDVQRTFASVPGAKLLNADCGSHVCRVQIQSDSLSSQRNLARDITGHPPFDQEVLYRYDDGSEPPTATLYVARAGTTLRGLLKD